MKPKLYETDKDKWLDFGVGLAIFIFGNVALAILGYGALIRLLVLTSALGSSGDRSWIAILVLAFSTLVLFLNMGVVIYAAALRKWMALGILAGIAVPLFLSICASVFVFVTCFMPVQSR
jgi:hypothetical protein